EMLSTCLDGLLHRTSYVDFEVILIDTGSTEPRTEELYAALAVDPRIRLLRYDEPFNFSRVCNFGVRQATGELILLLTNDVQILHADGLTRMAQGLDIPGVAIVGATLLYAARRIQHGGVVVGFGGLASNLFMDGPEHAGSIFGPEGWYRDVSAVSGACLLTSRPEFEALRGLDEGFALNYNAVDFCVRANTRGRRVVLAPDARLIHHGSATHRGRVPREDFLYATRKFERLLQGGDPYFNPNLSCHTCWPSLRREARDNPRDANT